MPPSKPPKVTGVEVVATRPTEADRAAIASLSAEVSRPLPQVSYLVNIKLETPPPATGQGWALYVGDFRIPKYWEYEHGIYFKLFDPQFFEEHKGQKLRFSQNGVEFIDTGKKLPAAEASPAPTAAAPPVGKATPRATRSPRTAKR
jgi:hypothetical protein